MSIKWGQDHHQMRKKNCRKSTTQHAPSVFHFDLLLTLYLSRFPLKIAGGGRKKFFSNPPKPRVLGGSEIDSTGQPPLPRNRKTRPSHRRNRNFPAECQRTNPTDNLGWIFGQTFGSVPRDPIFLWLFISLLFFSSCKLLRPPPPATDKAFIGFVNFSSGLWMTGKLKSVCG